MEWKSIFDATPQEIERMESETHLRGMWVNMSYPPAYFDVSVIKINEYGEVWDDGVWFLEQYTHFCFMPDSPNKPEPPEEPAIEKAKEVEG